jgi:hypothetical protein
MGYRSEVKYMLLFKTEEQRNTFKAHATLELSDFEYGKEILDQMEDVTYTYECLRPYQICVVWEDVKWYESYEWVQKQEELMRYVETLDGCGWVVARVGEENGDVEVKSDDNTHAYDHIDVVTTIDFL